MSKDRSDPPATWHQVAAALAAMPDAVEQLLREHREEPGSGRCRVCTVPGTGVPGAVWPCPVYQLARLARDIATGRPR